MDKRLIRIGGFVAKEIIEVLRQPRFFLSLILGPFLIMLLFGVGYVGEDGNLRAILVAPSDQQSSLDSNDYRAMFGTGNVHLDEITTDRAAAVRRLRADEVDVVVVLPEDAARRIGSGSQAEVVVLYNTIDPTRSSFVTLVTILYSNDLNRRLVARTVEIGQGNVDHLDVALDRVDQALGSVEGHLESGNRAVAEQSIEDVQETANALQLNLQLLLVLLQTRPIEAHNAAPGPEVNNLTQGSQVAARLTENLLALQMNLRDPNGDPQETQADIVAVRQDVSDMRALTTQFGNVNPYVLAAPIYARSENLAPTAELSATVFYIPGALALLLQHLAITLSSLSMVRERQFGRIEIFRVSPITPGEILAGKYIGFGLFVAVVAVLLLALVSLGLGVPIRGELSWLVLVLVLMTWASLGAGFAISMIAQTQNQAVQLGLLTLLGAVFFSGLFVHVEALSAPVRILSYILPATHTVVGLQDVMLKGTVPGPFYLGALAVLGLVFALFSIWRLSVEFRSG